MTPRALGALCSTLLLLLAACGDTDSGDTDSSDVTTSSTAEDVSATSEVEQPGSEPTDGFVDPDSIGLTGDVVQAAADATLAFDVLTFRTVVSSTVPGFFTGSTARDGSYQLATDTGAGSFYFGEADVASLAALAPLASGATLGQIVDGAPGQFFEYAIVDGTFWQQLDAPEGGVRWVGVAATEFVAATGSEPRLSIDGGAYLTAVLGSVALVQGVEVLDDGAQRWAVGLAADQVAPLVAGSGTTQRLFAAGFDGVTSLIAPAVIEIGADGTIFAIAIDVSEWWATGMRAIEDGDFDDVTVLVSFTFAEGGQVGLPETICDEPETDDSGAVPTLVCPALP